MIMFQKGAGTNELKFPLTDTALDSLEPSKLTSPRVGKSHGVDIPERLKELTIESDATREVMDVRSRVAREEMPWDFLETHWDKAWGDFQREMPVALSMEGLSDSRPSRLANVVHMDSPVDLGLAIMKYLLVSGAKPNDVQSKKHNAFLDTIPRTIAELAYKIDEALETAFEVKYFFGVPRPEEVMGGINCTSYPEGCPTHPSFPAGHGSAAGATASYFLNNWNLTKEQIYQVIATCYHWAMYRTFAGVHYAEDNLAGLKVGGL